MKGFSPWPGRVSDSFIVIFNGKTKFNVILDSIHDLFNVKSQTSFTDVFVDVG